MDRVCIIVPMYNEERYAKSTIMSLMEIKYADKIIVVDDGSTDRTQEIICSIKGIDIIRHIHNKGKGQSLFDGVLSHDSEIYLFADGDLGCTANRLEKLIYEIIQDKCDFCIANLPESKNSGGLGFLKAFSRFGVRAATGVNIPCPLSGQRAVKRSVIMDKRIKFYNGYGVEVGMLIDALNSGYKINIIDIELNHRIYGGDIKGILHRSKQFIDVLTVFITKFMRW